MRLRARDKRPSPRTVEGIETIAVCAWNRPRAFLIAGVPRLPCGPSMPPRMCVHGSAPSRFASHHTMRISLRSDRFDRSMARLARLTYSCAVTGIFAMRLMTMPVSAGQLGPKPGRSHRSTISVSVTLTAGAIPLTEQWGWDCCARHGRGASFQLA